MNTFRVSKCLVGYVVMQPRHVLLIKRLQQQVARLSVNDVTTKIDMKTHCLR